MVAMRLEDTAVGMMGWARRVSLFQAAGVAVQSGP